MAPRPQDLILHEYQKRAAIFMLERSHAGLFLDPGLGKTAITYTVFDVLKKKGLVRKMLVIAPLRPAISVWPREAQKWTQFGKLKVVLLHGPGKEAALASNADVYVINPEGLDWLWEAMRGHGWWWDMLVLDESTRFKHTNTQRFKSLRPRLPKFRRRYILTGTPAPNGLLDLFGQMYVVDLGNALGEYITRYRQEFFNPTGYGGYTWVLKEGADQRIYERLHPVTLRMAAQDYLELPPLIINDVRLELPDDVTRIYRQMEALLFADIAGKRVTAVNASVVSGKCRQIANGGIYTENGESYEHIHMVKAEAAAEIVEELQGKPALVAFEFKHDLERLREVLGKDTPYLAGGITPKRQREIEDAWNAGQIPVLLAQPQSVAHGLNLQGVGAAIIMHSMIWDLEVYDQFIRRIWRQGQKERVVVHRLMMEDTVDYVIKQALSRKDRTQGALLESLKMYAAASNRNVVYAAQRSALPVVERRPLRPHAPKEK